MTAAVSKVESLRCNAKDFQEEFQVAWADVALQSSLLGESRKQLDAKLMEMKEVQYQLVFKDEELITLYEQQNKTTAEFALLRTQSANKTAETTESGPVALESERPARREKVVCGSGSDVSAPSTAAYSALLSERDEFRNRCEALILKYQCTLGLEEEAEQLRAKVADLEKTNASAKDTLVRGKREKRSTVAERLVNALVAELKEARDAHKRRNEAAEESWKRAAYTAAQLVTSLRHIMKVGDDAKKAADWLIDI